MAPLRAARRAWLLLALLGLAAAAENSREGVFVGYKEAGVEGAGGDVGATEGGDAAGDLGTAAGGDGDGSLHEATDNAGDGGAAAADGSAADQAADSGAAAGQGSDQAAAQGGDEAVAADRAAAAEQVGRTVLLHTQFGPIKVKLLEKLAPRTTALVWELAQKRGCRICAFYRWAWPSRLAAAGLVAAHGHLLCMFQMPCEARAPHVCPCLTRVLAAAGRGAGCRNEARPRGGDGPPYALLQGRLDMPQARRLLAAFIPSLLSSALLWFRLHLADPTMLRFGCRWRRVRVTLR